MEASRRSHTLLGFNTDIAYDELVFDWTLNDFQDLQASAALDESRSVLLTPSYVDADGRKWWLRLELDEQVSLYVFCQGEARCVVDLECRIGVDEPQKFKGLLIQRGNSAFGFDDLGVRGLINELRLEVRVCVWGSVTTKVVEEQAL